MTHFYHTQVYKMSDNKPALPDRLAANPRSPHHVAECFEHEIGIRVNGKERTNVEEYCISEGWVKIPPQGQGSLRQPHADHRQGHRRGFLRLSGPDRAPRRARRHAVQNTGLAPVFCC